MSYIEWGFLPRIRLDDKAGFRATAREVMRSYRVADQLNFSLAQSDLFVPYFASYYAGKTNGPTVIEASSEYPIVEWFLNYEARKFKKREKIAEELLQEAQFLARVMDTNPVIDYPTFVMQTRGDTKEEVLAGFRHKRGKIDPEVLQMLSRPSGGSIMVRNIANMLSLILVQFDSTKELDNQMKTTVARFVRG